jgi:hypothetical protein
MRVFKSLPMVRQLALIVATVGVLVMPPPIHASDPPVKPATAGAVGPVAPGRVTSILGNAWTAENSPIPGARLRLRNVTTGKVEGATLADDMGRFRFSEVEAGTYVIELVNQSGHVLTIGHVFSIAPGESVATFVRLGTRVAWFTGIFGNAAAAVASAAASTGITALAPIARPASAGR